MNRLSKQEKKLITQLGAILRQYDELPTQHPDADADFTRAIHAAQNILLARPTARAEGWIKK